MEEVLKAFAPLIAFLSILFTFVMPSIVSITQRIKKDAIPDAKSWHIWLVAILLGVVFANLEAMVLNRVGLIVPDARLLVPDTLSTSVFGLLAGLSASGLVDLRKMGVASKPPLVTLEE